MIPQSNHVIRHAHGPFDGVVVLDYDARLLRRKRLSCDLGDFMVDLTEVTSLDDGDAFALSDGRRVVIRAATEPVLIVRGNLPRLAWHIGNRHTPCQIAHDRLIIRADHVLEAMLRGLGADVAEAALPFRPEGGAYGHGRTFGHDHGHAHRHDHEHA
ncbi:urease accessory protein UreE [Paracoccus sp. (in: a-proteobacteria)]|uniref:urease accessory protein UreE n=1 Tax=Paracoccus sp. TaxID=267 RepID=UPI003A86A719